MRCTGALPDLITFRKGNRVRKIRNPDQDSREPRVFPPFLRFLQILFTRYSFLSDTFRRMMENIPLFPPFMGKKTEPTTAFCSLWSCYPSGHPPFCLRIPNRDQRPGRIDRDIERRFKMMRYVLDTWRLSLLINFYRFYSLRFLLEMHFNSLKSPCNHNAIFI